MANPFENPAISTANTPPLQQELHHKTHTTHPDTLGLLGGASDIAAFAVLDSGSTQLRPHGLDANTVFGIRETENDLLRHRQHLVEINDLQILRDHGIDIDFLREYLSNMSFLNVRHNMLIVYGSTANSIYNQMTREKSPYTKPYRPDVSDTDVLVPGAMLLHLQDRWTLAAMSAGTLGDRFTTYRYQNSAQISGEPKQRHELFAVVSDTDRDLIQIHRATNHEAPAIVLYLDLLGKLHAKLLKPVPWDEGTDPVINPYNITASGLRAVGNLLAKLGDSEVTLQEKERVIDSSSVYSQKLPMIIIKMLRGLTIHDSLDDLDLENNYDCVRELALV
ncbi:hypothetical protein KC685_04875, partial [Candidatus Dojkabacteria bacterium]|nr:hypothetical protein [Candidatus Dojkabacteria bacterium]